MPSQVEEVGKVGLLAVFLFDTCQVGVCQHEKVGGGGGGGEGGLALPVPPPMI